jgi:hypothetical protein
MTTVKFKSGVEGPAYDPYAVDIVRVQRSGIEYVYESHSLGGDVIEIADHTIICDDHKMAVIQPRDKLMKLSAWHLNSIRPTLELTILGLRLRTRTRTKS